MLSETLGHLTDWASPHTRGKQEFLGPLHVATFLGALSCLSLSLPYLHPSRWPSLTYSWAPEGAPYLGSSHFLATAFTGDISRHGSLSAPLGLTSQQPSEELRPERWAGQVLGFVLSCKHSGSPLSLRDTQRTAVKG